MPTTTALIWLCATAAAVTAGGALAETKTQYESYESCIVPIIQGSAKRLWPGLVNFVPAVLLLNTSA